jgi:hypothetical protein
VTPRCNRTNLAGLRCRHESGHAGAHEPGAPDPEELDDESEAVLERGERRDRELREEEAT